VERWCVSADLAAKIRLCLDELDEIRGQVSLLMTKVSGSTAGDIETAGASAMLHSFYTGIEKLLELIGREWDRHPSTSSGWHRELLNRMGASTDTRGAFLSPGLVEVLGEFLAFRHLFRGASIALMRWSKISPLLAKVDQTYREVRVELESFQEFLESRRSAGI
jgi:hypothetical protein